MLVGLQPSEDRVELGRAGGDMKTLGPLLAAQVFADAKAYNAAFDAGFFAG